MPYPLAGLHLLAVSACAIAQPLYSLLAEHPEFFVARGNTAADIVILALFVLLAPPLVLLAIQAAVGRVVAHARRIVHLVSIGGLTALVALPALAAVLPDVTALLLPLALQIAVLAAYAYDRLARVRTFVTALSAFALVFPLSFLLLPPTSQLLFPDPGRTADAKLRSDAPVVMLVLDELPTSSLMNARGEVAKRLPAFRRLARDATWYRNATTPYDGTENALPAILAGRREEADEPPIAASYPNSLFGLLGKAGYDLAVEEPLTDLCPERLCGLLDRPPAGERLGALASDLSLVYEHLVLPADLREALPAIDRGFEDFRTPARGAGDPANRPGFTGRPRRFAEFARAASRSPRRGQLTFAHLGLPHWPWEFLPSGQQYPGGDEYPVSYADPWSRDERAILPWWQRHLLQVGFVDLMLGDVIQRLERRGIYDEALIVVVADHGVSFRPEEHYRLVTDASLPDIGGVPLFIKAPGQVTGRVDDRQASTLDVLPTVLDLLGGETPDSVEGRSLALPERRTPAPVEVERYDGEPSASLDFARFVRERDAVVRRQARLLGADTPSAPYRMGPELDELGLPVSSLSIEGERADAVTIEGVERFEAVDPEGSTVPARITGSFTGGDPGRPLAVAVNGRVVGAAVVFERDGSLGFSAFVPPSVFREGRNRVEILLESTTGFVRLGESR